MENMLLLSLLLLLLLLLLLFTKGWLVLNLIKSFCQKNSKEVLNIGFYFYFVY